LNKLIKQLSTLEDLMQRFNFPVLGKSREVELGLVVAPPAPTLNDYDRVIKA
jgi:hypothetical protein